MQEQRRSFFKIGFFLVAAVLLISKVTDADLSDEKVVPGHVLQASTLDMMGQETATGANKSLLFSVAGLIPTGFQVEGLRVSNKGELDFEYKATVVQTAGDNELCSNLKLRILRGWQGWYEGPLLGVDLTDQLSTGSSVDYILSLSLPAEASSLTNRSCSFALILITQDPTGLVKFSDEEALQNQVSTGSW